MRARPTHDLSPGTIVAERYEVARYLGEGLPGRVYLAVQQPLDREVVLKIMPLSSDDPRDEARFHREAEALSRLAHPACADVIDYGRWKDVYYLVLGFVTGPQLTDRLPPSGRWDALSALTLCIDLAEGLAHAHSVGVVHRNLSPERVVLTEQRGSRTSARMVDFGLAHIGRMELDTTAGARPLGTPGYMPPERVRGDPGDTRADVFAVGVILFEMLTGTHPFKRATAADTLSATVTDRVPRLDDVRPAVHSTPALTEAVHTATAPDAADRFKDGAELLLALKAARATLAEPGLARHTLSVDDGSTVLPPLLLERMEDPTPSAVPLRSRGPVTEPTSRLGCLVTSLIVAAVIVLGAGGTVTLGVLVGSWLAK